MAVEQVLASGAPKINVQESAWRYEFAAKSVQNLQVLDVACAAGLGSDFLKMRGAKSVVGLEISPEVLKETQIGYSPGVGFVEGDALRLPFPSASFDMVVTFETVEHLRDPRKFVAECRRVIKALGCLYLSTPNRKVSRWLPVNQYHIQEFTVAEIAEFVAAHFAEVEIFWQVPIFLPTFIPRKVARRWLDVIPGQRRVWDIWKMVRPERTRIGVTLWQGRQFDSTLFGDPYYRVVPRSDQLFWEPTYTVLVAKC